MTEPFTSASASSFLPPRTVDVELDPKLTPTGWLFACAIRDGTAFEIACWGARGEGKSWGALWGMVLHALEHQRRGFPLPVIWLGMRDTFANHKLSTHKSLMEPAWRTQSGGHGGWTLHDGGHVAEYAIAGVVFVRLELVGVDSAADAEKVRTQCHCVWAEEVAAVMELSAGIPIDLWYQAGSSARLATTHANVACLTSNMPDEDDAYWQRFHVDHPEGTLNFVIPSEERASVEYRARLMSMYATRPDLARRLVEGKPGVLMLGAQVAAGFNADSHVLYTRRLAPRPESGPLYLGIDGGESHTWCTVIAQRQGPSVCVLAAILSDPSGARQHVRDVLPWLEAHAPWALRDGEMRIFYDQACDTEDPGDAESNPLRTLRATLPGIYLPGPVSWAGRLNPMLNAFNLMADGQPVLRIDGHACKGLVKALNGGWYYKTAPGGQVSRDLPQKPNHPHEDYGDAFCYMIAGLGLMRPVSTKVQQTKARVDFDPYTHLRSAPKRAVTGWR
jgi:hypothetical protein